MLLVLGGVVETGGLILDRARLWHAAREAARVATVDGDPAAIEQAARASSFDDVTVEIDPAVPAARRRGDPVTVSLALDRRGRWPVIGVLFAGIDLAASVTMRIEQP